jgi:glycosyltransferase involved in cell wall biosynthesis
MTHDRRGSPARPARIAFLLPTFDIGGAERVVLRTARGLDPTRFRPHVLALVKGSGRLLSELETARVPATSLATSSAERPQAVWRLWLWLRRERPDALLTYMFHANQIGRVLGRAAGVKVVISSERVVKWETPTRIRVNRLTARLVDIVTTNSAAGIAFWQSALKLPSSRIRLIYNGVDTEVFSPRPRSDPPLVIGNLSRLHAKNDQSTLLEALSRLNPHVGSWRCMVAGEGPERDALVRQAKALGLTDRLRFEGHVSTPVAFLQGLDIYVQSSIAEGMPNAVLEAMACGLPCVATDVGGTAELVIDGRTGYLVPARDPAAIAARLGQLLTDPDLRARIAAAGRAHVERTFSLAAMVRATESLLDELLSHKST